METGAFIALLALVLASIAFLVATFQVLQQSFLTAEGWRRCQSSVMGQWAVYTERKFRWSEFRFETRFTIPHICFEVRLSEQLAIGEDHFPLQQCTVKMEQTNSDIEAARHDRSQWVCWVTLIEYIVQLHTSLVEEFPRHAYVLKNIDEKQVLPRLTFERKMGESLNKGRGRKHQAAAVKPDVSLPNNEKILKVSAPNTASWLHPLYLASCELREHSWDFVPPEVLKPLASRCIIYASHVPLG